MDVSRAQRQDLNQPPRNLYFGAEDLKSVDGVADRMHPTHRSRRYRLSEQVVEQARQLMEAIKAVRYMDRTGNAFQALDHVEDTLTDLTKLTRNLIDDVEQSEERWRKTHLGGTHDTDDTDPEPTPPAAARITPLVMVKTVESSVSAALHTLERSRAGR